MADPIINSINTSNTEYVSTKKESATESGDLDKDAFLQLLVTQMQYQDPLNPGDSTQYMSQLAQYSALEATMNISTTLDKNNGLNLVGQYVIMNTTDSAGNENKISGLVQYATVQDGEVLLSINDVYYPATDLDSVVDYDYYLYLNDLAGKGELTEEGATTDKGTETEGDTTTE